MRWAERLWAGYCPTFATSCKATDFFYGDHRRTVGITCLRHTGSFLQLYLWKLVNALALLPVPWDICTMSTCWLVASAKEMIKTLEKL